MNTKHIRKIAIAKALGEMIYWSCHYSVTDTGRDGVMEPEPNEVAEYLQKIAHLAWLHFLEHDEFAGTVKEVIGYCEVVARRCGHLFGNGCSTGTWGVRLGQFWDLQKIMALPDFELVPSGSIVDWYGSRFMVKFNGSTSIGTDWLVVEFSDPEREEQASSETCVYWNRLQDLLEKKDE